MNVAIPILCGLSVGLAGVVPALRTEAVAIRLIGQPPRQIRLDTPPIDVLSRVGRSGLARRLLGNPGDVRRGLEAAGRPFSLERHAGMKVACAVIFVLPGLVLASLEAVALVLVPIGLLLGARLPDLALAKMAARRKTRIDQGVPELVEIVVATAQAGLSPLVAFRRAAHEVRGPLGTELRQVLARVDLGTSWREALDDLVERTQVASLRTLAAALTRSGRLGTSVGSALRTVAQDLRAERRTRAEELARRAPVKMLFPLVFLILPAFLLLTVGPVVLATIRSLH